MIVDLHGGDPEDAAAKAEFREIKEKVMSEVCVLLSSHPHCSCSDSSGNQEKVDHTSNCGVDIGDARC